MSSTSLIDHLALLSKLCGLALSPESLRSQAPRQADGRIDLGALSELLRGQGLHNTLSKRALAEIPALAVPVLVVLESGDAAVVTNISGPVGGREFTVQHPDGQTSRIAEESLSSRYAGFCWFAKSVAVTDRRSGLPEYSLARGWLWQVLWRFRGIYAQVIVTTVVVNILALVSSLYVMNVYDRVIPNRAFDTLWALSLGVAIAILLEGIGRNVRARLTDIAGKKADLIISAALFRRVMNLHLIQKPSSSGSYANNLRDFEAVREVMTSATLLTLVDLPFSLLFLLIIGLVAGPLVWAPLLSMPLVIVAGVFAQAYLARYTNESMKESSQRHGLAVEAIEGLETLKALNATGWAQRQWERFTAKVSASGEKLKSVSTRLIQFSATVQQLNTVIVVLWGTYLIHDDVPAARITMGALMATVILSGRALAPLSLVASLMTRLNHARLAMQGIDGILARPIDRDATRSYVPLPRGALTIALQDVSFSYPEGAISLDGINLQIAPGERVAVLGRVGSGKSTLLRIIGGLYAPKAGSVRLNGIELSQADPTDIRSRVTLLGQSPRLFHGTLRENLTLALEGELISDELLMAALARFGLDVLVRSHPRGLDMPLGEDGQGLSGGQKQLLGLARLTLRQPQVVLLDEPTSGLDENTEQRALAALADWGKNRALVIVTHRPKVLEFVSRIMVIDAGRLMLDAPKDIALKTLTQGIQAPKPPQNVQVVVTPRAAGN